MPVWQVRYQASSAATLGACGDGRSIDEAFGGLIGEREFGLNDPVPRWEKGTLIMYQVDCRAAQDYEFELTDSTNGT